MLARITLAVLVPILLAACADPVARKAPASSYTPVRTASVGSSFAEAGDGTVIPDFAPDADAVDYARRCSGGRGAALANGMSECDLIGLKGTPSRVVGGLDQTGHSHNAIWYVEGGIRTVYKFDDDKLVETIH